MKKFMMMLLVTAMSVPAFANTDENVDFANEIDGQELREEGFVPADQIDFSYADQEAEQSALFQDRGPRRPGPGRPGPGRPGPGRPGPGRPGPRPPQRPPHRPQPPPRAYECEARDRVGYAWRARAWDLQRARYEAVRACEWNSRAPRTCRLVGCR